MFSSDFLQDAETSLWNSAIEKQDKNVLGFGFGVGLVGNEIDLSRPYVVRLYVSKKRKKTSRAKKRPPFEIPRHLEFDVPFPNEAGIDLHGREVDLPKVNIPTDVHEVGVVSGSGGKTKISGDPSVVTSGVVVRWRQSRSPQRRRWGIITVAHGFDIKVSNDQGPDTVVKNPATGVNFFGRRLLQFNPPVQGYDTVLISVSDRSLISQGFIRSTTQRRIRPMSFRGLANCKGAGGAAFQHGRNVAFMVAGTVGTLDIRNVGTVQRLVHVKAAGADSFVKTTSGSVYSVISPRSNRLIPAAIQIGADERTQFRDGYGQCLRDLIENLYRQMNYRLAKTEDRILNQIDLVSVF